MDLIGRFCRSDIRELPDHTVTLIAGYSCLFQCVHFLGHARVESPALHAYALCSRAVLYTLIGDALRFGQRLHVRRTKPLCCCLGRLHQLLCRLKRRIIRGDTFTYFFQIVALCPVSRNRMMVFFLGQKICCTICSRICFLRRLPHFFCFLHDALRRRLSTLRAGTFLRRRLLPLLCFGTGGFRCFYFPFQTCRRFPYRLCITILLGQLTFQCIPLTLMNPYEITILLKQGFLLFLLLLPRREPLLLFGIRFLKGFARILCTAELLFPFCDTRTKHLHTFIRKKLSYVFLLMEKLLLKPKACCFFLLRLSSTFLQLLLCRFHVLRAYIHLLCGRDLLRMNGRSWMCERSADRTRGIRLQGLRQTCGTAHVIEGAQTALCRPCIG